MRTFVMMVILTAFVMPAFANSDLKVRYLGICKDSYKKSAEFCQCSYDAFVNQKVYRSGGTNLAAIDFDKHRQDFEKRINNSEEVLFSDPVVSSSYVAEICRMQDNLQKYIGTPSGKLYLNQKNYQRKKTMTVAEQQKLMLETTAMRKEIHVSLTKRAVNSRSYSALSSGAICKMKRALKQLNEDEKSVPVSKNSSELTERKMKILSGSIRRQKIVVRAGATEKCPE